MPDREITDEMVLSYVARSVESMIEDDLNECGGYTDAEFEELTARALAWCGDHR